MKKSFRVAVAILMSIAMLLTFVACVGNEGTEDTTDLGNEAAISITVWCAENLVDLTKSQLEAWNTANVEAGGESVSFTVEAVGEGDAATNMITDVTAGADIYCFAQDQLARLVQAGALTAVSDSLVDEVTAANDAGSVDAATVNDTLYAFPLTSDNGYFMYYDTSVLSEDDIKDQASLIAACQAAGKTICFELTDSAWYAAAYFFATGCVSDWTTDSDGTFVSYVDTINSEEGIIAATAMAELINSGVFVNSSSAASFSSDAAVVVTGTWDYETACEALGDNLGCAELWSFTVDGEEYHLGSFSGNKLIGVKPQTDATKAAYCQAIANYLTSETCQQERFDALSWGPSNLNVQASSEVQANPGLAALAAQNAYATAQGQYPNAWWDVGKAIGASIQSLGTTTPTTDELQAILDTYTEGLDTILVNEAAAVEGWVVVGDLSEASWDCTGADGTYVISDGYIGTFECDIEVAEVDWDAGFRVILYNDWSAGDYDDNGIGYTHLSADSTAECSEGGDNNILVAPGSYHIILEVTEDTAVITVNAN